MFSVKVAFRWAIKIFLDDSGVEVITWGPNGPVVADKLTREEIVQSRALAA